MGEIFHLISSIEFFIFSGMKEISMLFLTARWIVPSFRNKSLAISDGSSSLKDKKPLHKSKTIGI